MTKKESRRRVRRPFPDQRIDLHQNHVRAFAAVDERKNCRVAGITAVPIRRAADIHRLKRERKTGRRYQRIDGQILALENMCAAVLHVGRADEKLDRLAGADRLDIQHLGEQVA